MWFVCYKWTLFLLLDLICFFHPAFKLWLHLFNLKWKRIRVSLYQLRGVHCFHQAHAMLSVGGAEPWWNNQLHHWQSVGAPSKKPILKQRKRQLGGGDGGSGLQINLSCRAGSRPAWATGDLASKQKQSILALLIVTASLQVQSFENSTVYIHSLWSKKCF